MLKNFSFFSWCERVKSVLKNLDTPHLDERDGKRGLCLLSNPENVTLFFTAFPVTCYYCLVADQSFGLFQPITNI